MDHATWTAMTPARRDQARDNSGLTKDLIGHEGWRVEVTRADGTKQRFIVGRSTGWRPCHLAIHNRRSHGGGPAYGPYVEVRRLYYCR